MSGNKHNGRYDSQGCIKPLPVTNNKGQKTILTNYVYLFSADLLSFVRIYRFQQGLQRFDRLVLIWIGRYNKTGLDIRYG